MSRTRVSRQMEATSNLRHRELLKLELDALDQKLRSLEQDAE